MIKKRTTTETVTVEKRISIVCDVCKKEYKFDNVNDQMAIQEFNHIYFTGGFTSIFGDGVECHMDICQYCLMEKLGNHIRKVNLHE